MITEEKLKIYKRYKGDIDGWVRNNSKKEKLEMSDSDWYVIDSLIQDLSSVEKRLTSLKFSNTLTDKLQKACNGIDTINQLKELTNNDW